MGQNKKNALLQCYEKALENYCKVKPRKGCLVTFFTRFRHSFKEYPALYKLRKALEQESDSVSALTLVINHLIAKSATFNNHSFNNYFMDELKSSVSFQHIDWDCFTPKAVKYYAGLLYRGDTRPPSVIFNAGFSEKRSSNFDSDYLKYYTGTLGISTSKDIDVAIDYAICSRNAMQKPAKLAQGVSYIYVIDYQGQDGFDILKTARARCHVYFSRFFHKKLDRAQSLRNQEVNIKGFVDPKYISGVFEWRDNGSLRWRENPVYDCYSTGKLK
jgi:CRISPR/Cas system Type II protein with McrA/HNH and RuvC-like nuclease domain